MEITIRGFIYHKAAESFTDCFDRYAVNIENHKFAISDGVSKSFFPGIWAELLVDKFVNTKRSEDKKEIKVTSTLLQECQQAWFDKVEAIVNKPGQKYFVRNYFNRGGAAAATFVGLEFKKRKGRQFEWRSYALGDSFLFFVPHEIELDDADAFDREVVIHSSKEGKEFDNFPDFYESRGRHKGTLKIHSKKSKPLKAGVFYLMTDALAEWFISEKSEAVKQINNWQSQDDFVKSIIDLRKDKLHNDDSAILMIKVEYSKEKDSLKYSPPECTNIERLIEDEINGKDLGNGKDVNQKEELADSNIKQKAISGDEQEKVAGLKEDQQIVEKLSETEVGSSPKDEKDENFPVDESIKSADSTGTKETMESNQKGVGKENLGEVGNEQKETTDTNEERKCKKSQPEVTNIFNKF